MIRSLDDARQWYSAVKKLVKMMDRISRRYWSEEDEAKTLAETLHRDDLLRNVDAEEIKDLAKRVLDDLDDLAVMLLFSVFEADVRTRTLAEMERELDALEPPLRHPVLKSAAEAAKDTIEHGSFGRLTESYSGLAPGVRTLVDQVRHYRNWVAHGRRGKAPNNINPDGASERLKRFLALLDADAASSATALLVDPTVEPGDVAPNDSYSGER